MTMTYMQKSGSRTSMYNDLSGEHAKRTSVVRTALRPPPRSHTSPAQRHSKGGWEGKKVGVPPGHVGGHVGCMSGVEGPYGWGMQPLGLHVSYGNHTQIAVMRQVNHQAMYLRPWCLDFRAPHVFVW